MSPESKKAVEDACRACMRALYEPAPLNAADRHMRLNSLKLARSFIDRAVKAYEQEIAGG